MARKKDNDLIEMFDAAFKKQPANEDLGIQTFFANVRANNWKSAHHVCPSADIRAINLIFLAQAANRMYKQFQEERYLYWAIITVVLQVGSIFSVPLFISL